MKSIISVVAHRPRAGLAVLCLAAASCAPDVASLGHDTYRTSARGHGVESFDTLKADAGQDAQTYCAGMGKTAKITDEKQLENVEREVNVTFQCQ